MPHFPAMVMRQVRCASGEAAARLGRGLCGSVFLLATATVVGGNVLVAQGIRSADSIPEIEPRLERLWGSDSIRLSVNMCGVQCSNQVSLSPTGRWILMQSFDTNGESSLWLAPTEGGGMINVASGPSAGGEPQWFPSGDAIAFTSPKAGQEDWFSALMRLPVSPDDGHPLGPPRQVSLEPVEPFALSPDGRSVAYISDRDPNIRSGSVLKVIPSTGGNPLAEIPAPRGLVMALRWDAEGRNLVLLVWRNIENSEVALFRIPAEGGEPELLSEWNDWVHLSPRARYLVRELPPGDTEDRLFEVATLRGEPLIRFILPGPFDLAGFGTRPGELLAVRQDIVNPLRVLPVAGGPIQRLNDSWGYDVPLGWTGDGKEIFFRTSLNGERAFMLAPVEGGPMRQVPLPANARRPSLSRAAGQVLFTMDDPAQATSGENQSLGKDLFLYDLGSDSILRVETPNEPFELRILGSVDGRGMAVGAGSSGAPFAYLVTRLGRHEVYLVDPSGASTLGWSIAEEAWTPGDPSWGNIAIHGNRLAFTENVDEQGTLCLSMAGDHGVRPLLTLPGYLGTRGTNPARWSPNGRFLTMSYRAPEADDTGSLLLVEVDEAGELVGEPRTLSWESGPEWVNFLQWMPDSQSFTAVGGMDTPGTEWDVWLISLDPLTPPVNLTEDLEGPVWYFHLSPDGRYVAFESEIPRGSSVWRVDLGDALNPSGR